MRTANDILQAAISEVDRERSFLAAGRDAFEEFREAASHVTPEPNGERGSSETAAELRGLYRDEIMEGLEHEVIYGDSLAESVEQELSLGIADALLSEAPFTQRRKRNLLLQTTAAIERREKMIAVLEKERSALETFADELADIEATIETLPKYPPERESLEGLLQVWERYDALERRCEELLERRQEKLQEAARSVRIFGDRYALNGYLYSDLESTYPVLMAIARTLERIDSHRTAREASRPVDSSMTS